MLISNVQNDSDLKGFAQKLELIKMNNINSIFFEMLPLCGSGTAIAFSKFLAMHKKISFGSYALIYAYKKEHQGLWGENLENPLWIRNMFFENAVEAYNTMVDYIYLVLYFNFNLYKSIGNTSIANKEDVVTVSKSVKGEILIKIDQWLANERPTKEFYSDFINYKESTKNLREMANDIKHRGCMEVEGMDLPRYTKVEIQGVNITDIVAPKIINLDEEIIKLVEIHRHTFDIQKKLYYLCDFQNKLKSFWIEQGVGLI